MRRPCRRLRTLVAPLYAALLLAAVLAAALPGAGPARAQSGADPEDSGALRPVERVTARHAMVVTANPHATQAALEMLRGGGNAVDAAVTAQWVLNVVEPQSSGLGGGGFLVLHDARRGAVVTLDGRETVPAAATPAMFLGPDGRPVPFYPDRITGGRAVGVPGLLRMLALALERHGTRTLAQTLAPAIRLAEEGFPVSPRLAASLARHRERLAHFPATRAVFFGADGEPLAAGALLRQPELARTLRTLAAQGPDAFYRGPIGAALVAAVRESPVAPGVMTAADLAGYAARERPPVRATYRGYTLYGMGPPSSGATTVFALLNLLETQPVAPAGPLLAPAIHRFVQAARLAYADRARYLGDPDQVPVPTAGLVDKAYAARRAAMLDWDAPLAPVRAGTPPGAPARESSGRADLADTESVSTTHLSIVDAHGNLLAMTTTIEQAFGSGVVVPGWGFLLNNQLTDFSLRGPDDAGRLPANALAPGRRPRSSMAPTLVFRQVRPVLVLGSPGGSRIIQYVAEVLVRVLDYGLPLQDAIEAPHHTHGRGVTVLEPPLGRGAGAGGLPAALRALGHEVRMQPQGSGLHGIRIDADGTLHGGADPRREGLAAGY
jgi:gamma-glutamyltranspeptidase/glutathione hydrolase